MTHTDLSTDRFNPFGDALNRSSWASAGSSISKAAPREARRLKEIENTMESQS